MSYQPHTAMDEPPDLCVPFLTSLPVSGATVAIVVPSGARLTLGSSDTVAARLDEVQFELGEGPQWAAARSGELVMIPDSAVHGHDDWPMFGAALAQLPVGALFCVPIRMGAVTLGVATLYCSTPRDLTADQQVTALAIASAIAASAAHQAMQSAARDFAAPESVATPALRREVHQATGVILVHLNTTATIAYARLQAYAFANGRTVQAVARDVVAGSITFEQSPP